METEELELTPTEPKQRVGKKKRLVQLTAKQQERFDKCFGVWVQKNGKGQGQITWAKYDFDDEMTEKIFQGILVFNKSKGTKNMTKEQKRFIPHFSTFLNNQGWVFEENDDGEYAKNKSYVQRCSLCGKEAKNLYPIDDRFGCIKCYDENKHPNFKKEVYENLCKRGLGKRKDETPEQYLQRMKQQGRNALRKFNENR